MFKAKLTIFIYLMLIITSKKFLERCDTMLTCDSCTRLTSNCGWCYSDGSCKSGNEIGPSFGSCKYSDWETTKCRLIECEKVNSILPCVTQKECFWCNNGTNSKCYNKSKLYDNKCDNRVTFELYFKNPDLYRDNLKNTLKIDIDKLSKGSKQLTEYDNFISKLKNYIDLSKLNYDLFNSINNPNGIFKYQMSKDKDKTIAVMRCEIKA